VAVWRGFGAGGTGIHPVRCIVPDALKAVQQFQLEICGHKKGYRMRGAKKIRGEGRLLYPCGGGQEGSDRQKQRNAEESSAQQAEHRTKKAVEGAEPDGRDGTAKQLGQQSGGDHGCREDEKKGCELGEGRRGNETGHVLCGLTIEPAGEEKAEDYAAEGEGFRDEAAHGCTHAGIDEDDAEDPVEWVHWSEAGPTTACAQSSCAKSMLIITAA
jgi:hypothetical protein